MEKLIQVIVKGLNVFEYLVRAKVPVDLSEISKKLGYPLATTHRLLATLIHKGYVYKTDVHQYKSTLKLFAMNNLLFSNLRAHSIFREYLKVLSKQVELSSHFGVYSEGKVLFADVFSSSLSLRVDVPAGTVEYLHSTGMGKVLMAYMSKDQVEEIIRQIGLPKFTERTITDKKKLYLELQRIRQVGYAVDDEEATSGAKCIAVPIGNGDEDKTVIAALSVAGPASQIPENRIPELIPALRDTARKIESLITKVSR